MELPPEVKAKFAAAGSIGGKKRMSKLSKRQRRELAMKGVAARRRRNGAA